MNQIQELSNLDQALLTAIQSKSGERVCSNGREYKVIDKKAPPESGFSEMNNLSLANKIDSLGQQAIAEKDFSQVLKTLNVTKEFHDKVFNRPILFFGTALSAFLRKIEYKIFGKPEELKKLEETETKFNEFLTDYLSKNKELKNEFQRILRSVRLNDRVHLFEVITQLGELVHSVNEERKKMAIHPTDDPLTPQFNATKTMVATLLQNELAAQLINPTQKTIIKALTDYIAHIGEANPLLNKIDASITPISQDDMPASVNYVEDAIKKMMALDPKKIKDMETLKAFCENQEKILRLFNSNKSFFSDELYKTTYESLLKTMITSISGNLSATSKFPGEVVSDFEKQVSFVKERIEKYIEDKYLQTSFTTLLDKSTRQVEAWRHILNSDEIS